MPLKAINLKQIKVIIYLNRMLQEREKDEEKNSLKSFQNSNTTTTITTTEKKEINLFT